MNKQEIILYLHKLAAGTCSAEEQVAFDKWVQETDMLQYKEILLLWEQINNERKNFEQPEASFIRKIQSGLDKLDHEKKIFTKVQKVRFYKWAAVAASLIICVGTGFYFFQRNVKDLIENNRWARNDIAPGKNKAILTVGGQTINLSDAVNGNLVNQAGITITKTKNGQLIYKVRDAGPDVNDGMPSDAMLNTITTPKGGQWQINLPDGTQVWLNAASSLKFPAKFASNERKVTLNGEAYFVVKHNAKQPFRVQTARQVVEDIGTAFNVNSYPDENVIKTTLIAGSARVLYTLRHSESNPEFSSGSESRNRKTIMPGNEVVLTPNQQSTLTNTGIIKVTSVNIDEAISWKDGKFRFVNTDLEVVLRQLSRWYDVNIQYIGKVPDRKFTGWIDRKLNASEALEILKYMKVNFEIEGKTIIVSQ